MSRFAQKSTSEGGCNQLFADAARAIKKVSIGDTLVFDGRLQSLDLLLVAYDGVETYHRGYDSLLDRMRRPLACEIREKHYGSRAASFQVLSLFRAIELPLIV